MKYNKLAIIPLCLLAGIAVVVCAGVAIAAYDPATLALETAADRAQAEAAHARAQEADAQAGLALAQAQAEAVQSTVETANGTLALWAFSFPLAPPLYIGVGLVLGGCGAFFAGAWWGAERERGREHVIVNVHEDRAGSAQ